MTPAIGRQTVILFIDVRLHHQAALKIADGESHGHWVRDALEDFAPAFRREAVTVSFGSLDADV
jgi:capsule polysaccharide modification protein KpsS